MSIEIYESFTPKLHPSAYVHPSAVLIGEVELSEDTSVWPTCVLRGDNGRISIGARTNLQDGTICHATLGQSKTTVANDVTIGHRVTLHGCKIGQWCLVGMGSTILDGAELGEWCFVAAGSLLTPGRKFEPRSFIVGSPGKKVREVKQSEIEMITHAGKVYVELARQYRAR
jgi:carbonic anhydrase/acetyltransferase-like protein (isoleucine patch superfamily)